MTCFIQILRPFPQSLRNKRFLSVVSSEIAFNPSSTNNTMSSVTLLVIANNKLSIQEMHYRHVISILESSCFGLDALLSYDQGYSLLDAGYLLIDIDRKVVLSGQDAFSINHLPLKVMKKLKTDYEVVVA